MQFYIFPWLMNYLYTREDKGREHIPMPHGSFFNLFLSTKSLPQLKDQCLPSEELSFILDTENLIGIMGNEYISFQSRTRMSELAGLELGNM